ncbi:4Fe-4S ferredoxin iron-sulfur binding domain-containing protein [Clostridium sp. CAG:356]|nr:4Fe-4S ferredoxin iron-sulfur binding domain-containing protein [Clostridium sp. CAG:356]
MSIVNNLDNFKFKCTGCNCCKEICPKKAIKFESNKEGFLEYKIDKEKCINCGLCIKKCPQLNEIKKENFNTEYYAAHSKSEEVILKSTSGGMFTILANAIAQANEYAIFGCFFDEKMVAKHGYVNDIKDLDKFKGSKYIQSDTQNIFQKVKEQLEEGKVVLFTGTPCQIAGLRKFLENKNYDNLYTIDIICHGVPSPLLFKKYKEYLEQENNAKLIKYEFRNKSKKTWELCYYYYFDNGKHKSNVCSMDSYYSNFIDGTTYRECCYECKYAKKDRISDITIGDFWGIQNEHPNNYNKYGNSAIIVNTKKGKELFEKIKNDINFEKSSFEKISKYNKNLKQPTVRKNIRDNIYNEIKEKNYEQIVKENMKFKISAITIIKAYFPRKLKDTIKKILK